MKKLGCFITFNIFDNEPNRPVIDTLISKRDIKRYFQYQTKAVCFKV